MSWHDATVHAFAASPDTYEFLLDLDDILRWEEPDPAQGYYTFWVAPVTLVFHNAFAVEVHIGRDSQGGMTILDLERTDEQLTPNGNLDWQWSSFGVGGTLAYGRRAIRSTSVSPLSTRQDSPSRSRSAEASRLAALH